MIQVSAVQVIWSDFSREEDGVMDGVEGSSEVWQRLGRSWHDVRVESSFF